MSAQRAVPFVVWGGDTYRPLRPLRSEVDGVAPTLEPIGVGGQRPVVDEVHNRPGGDPEPLVSRIGVGVRDLAVDLFLQVASEPEARRVIAAELRQLLRDEVQDIVRGVDADSSGCVRSVSHGSGSSVEDVLVDDEPRHDASPSAAEGAEPGLASTLSVEGDPAAGASAPEVPAAPSSAALDAWAGEIAELVGQFRETTLLLRAAHPLRDSREFHVLHESRNALLAALRSLLFTGAPEGTRRIAEALAALVDLAAYPSPLPQS